MNWFDTLETFPIRLIRCIVYSRRIRWVGCFFFGHKDVRDDPLAHEPYRCARCWYAEDEINLWGNTVPDRMHKIHTWLMDHTPLWWLEDKIPLKWWHYLPDWMEY
jgi:hypothetical protein